MYSRSHLGQVSPVASTAISTVAKYGSQFAVSTFAPVAFGSYAGPIGTAVGLIVSIVTSFFGPKPKTPRFQIIAIIPEKFGNRVPVGGMLDILTKRMVNLEAGWGMRDPNKYAAAVNSQIGSVLRTPPPGALGFLAGGLPTAHKATQGIKWEEVRQATSKLAQPFLDTLSRITDDEIKRQILREPLPWKQNVGYNFTLGGKTAAESRQKPIAGLDPLVKKAWWDSGIAMDFNTVVISDGKEPQPVLDQAMRSIPKRINEVFVKYAGVDVVNGQVTNAALAEKAFKPTAASLVSSPLGLLLLAGGAIFLFSRRGSHAST